MDAAYFTNEDHSTIASQPNRNMQVVLDKMLELHRLLHRRMRDHNWDLHPHWDASKMITTRSAACTDETCAITLPYLRSRDQRQLVERLMGREGQALATAADIDRHPVIELRLTPTNFAIELIMSPSSWWDQRNLIGKLAVDRHRRTMHSIFQGMDGDYRFGFWGGITLSDMHLTSYQVLRGNVLNEWMGTFADGQDWLRVGVWYEPESPALNGNNIMHEIVRRMDSLYKLYTFMLWTSNNNFQSFYRGGVSVGRGGESRL